MAQRKKGQVKSNAPMVQLAAELPDEEEVRARMATLKMNDGFAGSCGLEQASQSTEKTQSEKMRYKNADQIYE